MDAILHIGNTSDNPEIKRKACFLMVLVGLKEEYSKEALSELIDYLGNQIDNADNDEERELFQAALKEVYDNEVV